MKRKNANVRVLVIFICILLIGGIISFNVAFTTLSGYHLRSMTNVLEAKSGSQDKTETLGAKRGYIKDRNGSIIAQDQDTYTIRAVLYQERSGEYSYVMDRAFTAASLAPIIGMSEEEILSYLDLQDTGQYQTYFGIKGKNLTIEQKEAIEAIEYTVDPKKEKPGLPGIEFETATNRVYTPGKFSSTLLGFASYEDELNKIVGRTGIEAYLNEELTGEDGYNEYQKDAFGYKIPGSDKTVQLAVDGNDVYLTLDKEIQSALESALQSSIDVNGAERAWAIIMEVETGKILGWAGYPTYDLNSRDEVLYMDLPSMYVFEPGSVMKPFAYAAAIDSGVYKAEDTVVTGRYCIAYNENGEIYRSWDGCPESGNINDATREGWGTITFDEGLIRSSNTVIATLLTDYLSTDVFWDYLDKLGFFKQTGIEGLEMSEEFGIKNDGSPIDRIAAGFGQGSAVTALQMVQAYTAIFNDGYMVKPYYIDKIVNKATNEVDHRSTQYVHIDKEGNPLAVFKEKTCDKVISLMKEVMQNQDMGTGKRYNIEGIDMIGKTGTGEIAMEGKYGDTIFTSSVMAAAPASDPKIMMYYVFQGKNYLNYSTDFFKNAFMTAYETMGISTPGTTTTEVENTYDTWQEYQMPLLLNHSLRYANWKLDEMNVNRVIIGDGNNVVNQFPTVNNSVSTNQNIFILTDGTTRLMPNMIGWSFKDVETFKRLSGLNIMINGNGVVSTQSVEADTTLSSDTEISVQLY